MADTGSLERATIFAEEDFVVELQTFLHQLMENKGISRADLARAMGVSRARVTQLFSDECKNFTVRLLARAMHALGEKPEIICRTEERRRSYPSHWRDKMLFAHDLQSVWEIKEMFEQIRAPIPCNDQAPLRLTAYGYSQLEWEAA